MSTTPFILDADREHFDALVLGNSHRGLVLAYFWTPRAGPCLRLMPRLLRLAEHYGGRFLLVRVNTDLLGAIARAQGVTSVPTVKFYLDGRVVHTIHGAEPDSTFHAALDRYIARPEDQLRAAALHAHAQGRLAEAVELMARAAVEQPARLDIAADLAKLLTLDGQPERALALLASLPPEARRDARIAPLLAHLELLDAARHGPPDAEVRLQADPTDAEARLALAARDLLADRLEAAMEGLLALARSSPGWREDIGRRGLLALFALLGDAHPLTRTYRTRLSAGS
ncbi:MAG: tetratricopeptide repeat protein [Thiobacillaceae bacterium]|nr:tetratricopeptide repeat protein [Thiobacillaceae bacterium]MCX7672163.1 tetratricopeptide repeat protein [Thiobacillaceae bacterium]MDW8323880.1 tetratricopeptide repeat protein [Burkholderiales bacterium]